MAYVYAVLHNGNGDFIICRKNEKGYFFHNKSGTGGSIYPNGVTLNGGGFYSFPGGTPDVPGVVDGAREELEEEMAIEVGTGNLNPAYYNGGKYYGVYFSIGKGYADTLQQAKEHLAHGQAAALAVADGTYTQSSQYEAMLEAFNICPQDNELNGPESWNVFYDRDKIEALNKVPTDWFYRIIMNLSAQLFPCRVYDVSGRLVGMAQGMAEIDGPQFILRYILFDPVLLTTSGVYKIVYMGWSYAGLTMEATPLRGGVAAFKVG